MRQKRRFVKSLLLETGFLLALNPLDRNHSWAVSILNECRRKHIKCYLSPAAPVEVSLVLKSRGFEESRISRVLRLMESIVAGAEVRSLNLGLSHAAKAAVLRGKYPELGFFDSLHAALAIEEGLEYGDLDETVRNVVERERSG